MMLLLQWSALPNQSALLHHDRSLRCWCARSGGVCPRRPLLLPPDPSLPPTPAPLWEAMTELWRAGGDPTRLRLAEARLS